MANSPSTEAPPAPELAQTWFLCPNPPQSAASSGNPATLPVRHYPCIDAGTALGESNKTLAMQKVEGSSFVIRSSETTRRCVESRRKRGHGAAEPPENRWFGVTRGRRPARSVAEVAKEAGLRSRPEQA
jgi:hypothetical protein